MPQITASKQGVLITCDVPTRQLILHLNEKVRFVIKECDDTHVLIDPAFLDYVKSEIEEAFEKNIWDSNAPK